MLGLEAPQASNEGSTERLKAERAKVADRLDTMGRWMPVVMIPIALVALLDLATGWGANDRVIDLVLLGVVAFVIVDSFWLRRLARRMRSGELSPPPHCAAGDGVTCRADRCVDCGRCFGIPDRRLGGRSRDSTGDGVTDVRVGRSRDQEEATNPGWALTGP